MTSDIGAAPLGNASGEDQKRTLRFLGLTCVGILILAVLALVISQTRGLTAAIGIGVLIIFAAAAIGAALGFLFALPRVLSSDPKNDVSADGSPTGVVKKRVLGSNTNLERVSDWLTTMIVGVALTQLGEIDSALLRFRLFIAETARVFPKDANCIAQCSAGALPVVAPLLLIFGLVAGFITLYLFTRLKLSSLFQGVEDDLNRLSGIPGAAVKQAATQASQTEGGAENPTIQAVLSSPQPSVDESLGLMYSLLYRPNGYQQVIDLGGKLSNSIITKRPEFWFYQAAAFGQKYHELKKSGATEELQSAKDNMLDCARRAVILDPAYKFRLWHISDPEGTDNDLADFREDPDFLKLVGSRQRRN
jgi:hypothetical protein